MKDELKPKDHAEAVAHFRAQVLGPVLCGDLAHGELKQALQDLASKVVRPPGSAVTRRFSVPTLERWLAAYRKRGIEGLRPRPRSDRGYAQQLEDETRELLLDIRREHPTATTTVILRTLQLDGRLAVGCVSANTIRRLYRSHGLDGRTLRAAEPGHPRRRWEAKGPGVLWHADVCHGPSFEVAGQKRPLRIHAILDDASRYIVGIVALDSEREVDMLGLWVAALRQHGLPKVLYLDNGATYRGEILATACHRLGISLVHAKPYDPQARGKMERFWRTLRQGCLDHLQNINSLHDVQVRLLAFVDKHYHLAAHASLMGRSPKDVWGARPPSEVREEQLHEALTVRGRRLVHRDGTLSVGGKDWELEHGYLAGRHVVVGRSLVDPTAPPWVEDDDKRFPLRLVDVKANGRLRRTRRNPRGIDAVPFDPAKTLVDVALGRRNKGGR